MNTKMKKIILKALQTPVPDAQEKANFLRTLPKPQIGTWQFLLRQAAFLRRPPASEGIAMY